MASLLQGVGRAASALLLLLLITLGVKGGVGDAINAAAPDSAPPLAAPAGPVVNVSTLNDLQQAVVSAGSGTTIVVSPGTYRLSGPLYINRAVSDLTIRGATNNRNDVVLQGLGMHDAAVPFGIWTGNGVTRLTIANLTIRDVYYHPIIFNAGTQQPRVYNVRLVNAGQQFVKANPDGNGSGVDGGVVEYSVIEYEMEAPSDYTNGVDVHTGAGWVIRHNIFRKIRSAQGLAGPAVLMWNNSRNTVVEGNTFIDNHRDVSLGLVARTPNDHTGGIIRNNMIVRTPGAGGDVAIAVFDSPGTRVIHNTIWLGGAYPNAVEYRFTDATGLIIANNLSDGALTARDGASASLLGNVTTAPANYFKNAPGGDLHLTPAAALAIDRVTAPADVPDDWDGQARTGNGQADVGADERDAASTPPPTPEVCGDGRDNDGDGLIDEGCSPLPPPPSPPPPPVPTEVCGDGLDNDGDGLTDENCAPPPSPPAVELCGDGVDNDTDGLIDEDCEAAFAPVLPGAPSRLYGSASGNTVRLAWRAPIIGGEVSGYVLEAGLVRGQRIAALPLAAVTEVQVPGVAPGTYHLRVRAAGPGGLGPASNEVVVTVGSCVASTPRDLAAAANGPRVLLTWADDRGCSGQTYTLLAGSRPGAIDVGALPVPAPPFELVVPAGTYFVRISADGATGTSNELRLAPAGACRPPEFPLNLSGRVTAGRVSLAWAPAQASEATAADAATSVAYVVEAGRSRYGSDIASIPLGRRTTFVTTAPTGEYFLRVRAVNACGSGRPSNEVVVKVP